MSVKERVKFILANVPETRNNDVTLAIAYWKLYEPSYMAMQFPDNLYHLTKFDNLVRMRAYWQNTKKQYLPTIEEVAKKRKVNMEEWFKEMKTL